MAQLRTRVLRRLSAGRPWYPVLTVGAGVGRGLRMSLRNASADYSVGTNELPVQEAIRDHLSPGAVFFDVGANVGFFSLLAARLVGPTGAVHAFEPVPANAACIRANVAANRFGNVTVWPMAVGRAPGTATMRLARHPGGATLAGDLQDPAGTLTVEVVTLDGLVGRGALPAPTLVKVDVEGAEADVLAGMTAVLDEHRPVVLVEADAASADGVAAKTAELVGQLEGHGYATAPLGVSYAETAWQVRHVLARPVG